MDGIVQSRGRQALQVQKETLEAQQIRGTQEPREPQEPQEPQVPQEP